MAAGLAAYHDAIKKISKDNDVSIIEARQIYRRNKAEGKGAGTEKQRNQRTSGDKGGKARARYFAEVRKIAEREGVSFPYAKKIYARENKGAKPTARKPGKLPTGAPNSAARKAYNKLHQDKYYKKLRKIAKQEGVTMKQAMVIQRARKAGAATGEPTGTPAPVTTAARRMPKRGHAAYFRALKKIAQERNISFAEAKAVWHAQQNGTAQPASGLEAKIQAGRAFIGACGGVHAAAEIIQLVEKLTE
jgi:hypothetical protein